MRAVRQRLRKRLERGIGVVGAMGTLATVAGLGLIGGATPAAAAPQSIGSTSDAISCGTTIADWVQSSTVGPTYTIPAGLWDITSWDTDGNPYANGAMQLEVWRPTGAANQYELVGISPVGTITTVGNNMFSLAQPIRARGGDVLGMRTAAVDTRCISATPEGASTYHVSNSASAPTAGDTLDFGGVRYGAVLNIAAVIQPASVLFNPITPGRIVDTRVGTGAAAMPLAAGQTLVVPVAGVAGVPSTAVAATLNVTATNATPGYLTVYPCGPERPNTSTVNAQANYPVANLTTVELSISGAVCVYSQAATDLVIDATGWWGDTGLRYSPATNERLVDTRTGIGAPAAPIAAGQTATIQVTGRAGIAPGTTVAALNLTATNSTPGFVTAYACDQPRPATSNVNTKPFFAVANIADVSLSAAGTVCVYSEQGTDLLVDALGSWTASGGQPYNPVSPTRIVDTRTGLGAPAISLTAGQTLTIAVAGQAGIPTGAVSAALNVTTVESAQGFVTLYPCDGPRPATSTVNPQPGTPIANLAQITLSATGTVCAYTDQATQLIIDALGWTGTP
jgi:hypothetical protein